MEPRFKIQNCNQYFNVRDISEVTSSPVSTKMGDRSRAYHLGM